VQEIFRIPSNAMRMVFYIGNGITTVILFALWRPTGGVVWMVPTMPYQNNLIISTVLFWMIFGLNFVHLTRGFGFFEFIGISQLLTEQKTKRTVGMPKLVTDGFYRYVRHPIYTITLAALFISTIYTTDRIFFIISALLYLSVGIPYEEKKLIEIFGKQYETYSKKVPAIVPFL